MDDETRLAFYEAFKKNPDDALQTFEKNSEKVDEWVRTGKVDGVVSFGKYATKIDEAVIVLEKESLFGDLASTFLDSEYRTVKSTKQVTTYRSFGLKAELGGSFVTTKKGATRNELAILDEWNNSMRFEATINIPAEVKMNVGKVGTQTSKNGLQTLAGGGDQVILPYQWDNKWIIEIKDLNTGKVYTSITDFSKDFPELVK